MIKKFTLAALMLVGLAGFSYGQKTGETKYRKISQIIADSRKVNGMFTDLLGGMMPAADAKTESTVLSAINLPNSVKVRYTGKTRKIGDKRKEIVRKWLKDYAGIPEARYFYVNEVQVEEDGVKYWVMSHENTVVMPLKNFSKQNNGEVILKMKILGYTVKGKNVEHYLLSDGIE